MEAGAQAPLHVYIATLNYKLNKLITTSTSAILVDIYLASKLHQIAMAKMAWLRNTVLFLILFGVVMQMHMSLITPLAAATRMLQAQDQGDDAGGGKSNGLIHGHDKEDGSSKGEGEGEGEGKEGKEGKGKGKGKGSKRNGKGHP